MEHPHTYVIHVAGRLNESVAIWFEGMRVMAAASAPGTTALVGSVRDQTELYGHLCKLRDLHLTLLALHRVADAAEALDAVAALGTVAQAEL